MNLARFPRKGFDAIVRLDEADLRLRRIEDFNRNGVLEAIILKDEKVFKNGICVMIVLKPADTLNWDEECKPIEEILAAAGDLKDDFGFPSALYALYMLRVPTIGEINDAELRPSVFA